MKMGIKEFRDRLGEVARGDELVALTDRGRIVGYYTPVQRWDEETARQAVEDNAAWQADLRRQGVNTEDLLAEIGLDPWGVPLERHDR